MKFFNLNTALLFVLSCFIVTPGLAQQDPTESVASQTENSVEELAMIAEYEAWEKDFNDKLELRTGDLEIADGHVLLTVPEEFYFLDKTDARAVLEEAWGNPEDDSVLGMIFPAKFAPTDELSWGIAITYDKDGYVSDKDAASTDYDELMQQMQAGVADENEYRREMGYSTYQLIGWAEEPTYNPDTHKMYWAKALAFEGSEEETLNYNVRVLGRRGVLNLNFIATMPQLDEIKSAAPTVLDIPHFTEGNRYTDYKKGDKKADYTLAALVAGGAGLAVVKKTGLLAVLLIALKKFGVFILVGLGAALRWMKGLFTRSE
ncbi:MAG: DUF2167 domain-containing protein [bacterium]